MAAAAAPTKLAAAAAAAAVGRHRRKRRSRFRSMGACATVDTLPLRNPAGRHAHLEQRPEQQQLSHDAAHRPHIHRPGVVPSIQEQLGGAVPAAGRQAASQVRAAAQASCSSTASVQSSAGCRAAPQAGVAMRQCTSQQAHVGQAKALDSRGKYQGVHQMVTTTPLFHRGSSGCRTERPSPKSAAVSAGGGVRRARGWQAGRGSAAFQQEWWTK